MSEVYEVKLGIREFSVPVPRQGSLEMHSGYGPSLEMGAEIHRIIQRRRLADPNTQYEKEVHLKRSFARGDYLFHVSGRMDGLILDQDPPLIEEIKSTTHLEDLKVKLTSSPWHPYNLQVMTYGYIYYKENGILPQLAILIVSSRTMKEELVPVLFDLEDYEQWLEKRLAELIDEQRILREEAERRQDIYRRMCFPFEKPRPGQIDLMETVEQNFKGGAQVMIQAPTGLGKTMGILFPALKESLGRGEQTFYVTPKNSQHAVAEDAVTLIRGESLPIKSLTLTAKGKICLKDETFCNPKHCEYAKDYYQKVHETGLLSKLQDYDHLNADIFTDYAHQFEVCPFELSLDASYRCDLIIGDYNYAFSPSASLKRYENFDDDCTSKPNLIVDEAHNLYGRACDYLSPSLSTGVLEGIRDRMSQISPVFAGRGCALIDKCIDLVMAHDPKDGKPSSLIQIHANGFFRLEDQLTAFATEYFTDTPNLEAGDPVNEFSRYLSKFNQISFAEGEEFFATFQTQLHGDEIKITCCDASQILREKLRSFANVAAFSATIKPFEFYGALSGFDPDRLITKEFTSPFPEQNRMVLVIPQISTKYRDRERNYPRIAQAIIRICGEHPGNYFAFFPSFTFLNRVGELLEADGVRVLRQTPQMSKVAVHEIMEAIKSPPFNHVVLGVQGGIFSEGVDYPGEQVIGAFIVGPALPNFNLERETIRAYYDKHYGSGFDYAYTFPAMAKSIQAAGRVIRTETDRGLIVLMDRRFASGTYAKSMPDDWYQVGVSELVSTSILSDVKSFWENHGSS